MSRPERRARSGANEATTEVDDLNELYLNDERDEQGLPVYLSQNPGGIESSLDERLLETCEIVETRKQPAEKAVETISNISNSVAQWFNDTSNRTKQWISDVSAQSNQVPKPKKVDEKLLSVKERQKLRMRQMSKKWHTQSYVPDCYGEILLDPSEDINASSSPVYKTLKISVPPGVLAGQEFFVVLPTGLNVDVSVPLHGISAGDEIWIPYRSRQGSVVNSTQSKGSTTNSDDKLINFYKKYNPVEREALLQCAKDGQIGIEVFDGEFGCQVLCGAFAGTKNMLLSGDVILALNGTPIGSVEDFQSVVGSIKHGEYISLDLLRRSFPPAEKCPAGHALDLVQFVRSIYADSYCSRCSKMLLDTSFFYTCESCEWYLCESCYHLSMEASNSDVIGNDGQSSWKEQYQEDMDKNLTFSEADIGEKIRLYWESTGEWWIGEIVGYSAIRGHEILYEEEKGGSRHLSRQIVPDLKKHHYRLLQPRPLIEYH